jgi:hypothetical protein
MREKVLAYLKKPSPKLLAELTTMEQKWVKGQQDGDTPATAKNKKP